MRTFLFLLAGLFFIVGCGKNEKAMIPQQEMVQPEKTEGKSMTENSLVKLRKPNNDEIGKLVTCPVMGTKFNVKEVTDVADYKGKSYYFCCAGCYPEFEKNPNKYTK